MPTIVGVKLRFAPKVVFFDPADTEPRPGDAVIVQTDRGVEIGQVVDVPTEVDPAKSTSRPSPIVRIATEEDLARAEELAGREREALKVYRSLIEEHKLDMKPVDVEFLFGDDKVVFYFVAEERIDFRELVRELASRYKMRIDMRQVGVRDEARMVGGIGHCGQMLCCVRFAGDFQPVSIRMAKEQDLPLNPLKISGLCGRLMCCLRYEYDAYKDFKQRAPKKGTKVETPEGEGKVTSFNTPREIITVRLSAGGSMKVPLEAMECPGGGCPCTVSAEAMDVLKAKEIETGVTGPVRELTESSQPREKSVGIAGGDIGPEVPQRKDRAESTSLKKESGDRQQEATGSGRSRKRRKSRGGSSGSQGAGSAKKTEAAGGAQGSGAASTEAGKSAGKQPADGGSGGRRRRRRRSGGPKKDDSAGA